MYMSNVQKQCVVYMGLCAIVHEAPAAPPVPRLLVPPADGGGGSRGTTPPSPDGLARARRVDSLPSKFVNRY